MPEFLDFVFLFGYQKQAIDLYCSGFRHRTRLLSMNRGLEFLERNWSGYDFQVCYSLKSVEHSGIHSKSPWSIHQCALNHSFDTRRIRSTWVIIKGDSSVESRIQSVAKGCGPAGPPSYATIDRAFVASLAIHMLVCDWSAENWRWYTQALEARSEALTDATTFTNADVTMTITKDIDLFQAVDRTDTRMTHGPSSTAKSRISSLRNTLRGRSKASNGLNKINQKLRGSPQIYMNSSGNEQPRPPDMTRNPAETSTMPVDEFGQRVFSFKDLQHVHNIEEEANEAILILKLNANVIGQLKQFYCSIMESGELPYKIVNNCKGDMIQFRRHVDGVLQDFDLQILRVEALLLLLANRKTLVSVFQSRVLGLILTCCIAARATGNPERSS